MFHNVSHCASPTHCSTFRDLPSMNWAYQMQRHGRRNDETCRSISRLCYPLLLMLLFAHTMLAICYRRFILFTLCCERFSNICMALSLPPVPVRELQHLCDQHTSMQLPAPFYGSDLCTCVIHAECWRGFIVLPSYPTLPHLRPR